MVFNYTNDTTNNICFGEQGTFQLGLSHLDARGLSASWLMTEAGHLHTIAIAEEFGTTGLQGVDEAKRRSLASVVTTTHSGALDAFSKDMLCQFRIVVRPCAASSWLSQIDLESSEGNRICVEIMTASVLRDGHVRTHEVRSGVTAATATSGYDPTIKRAQNLRNLWHIERQRAHDPGTPPHASFQITDLDHVNGLTLENSAQFQNFFSDAEENALSKISQNYSVVARRMHFYGIPALGDKLDIVTDVRTSVHNLPTWLMTYGSARRRSDGALITACESSYRVTQTSCVS